MPDSRLISCSEGGGYNISFSGVASAANIYINGAYRAREFYNTAISPGWHFFTFTYDNRYLKLYFDGVYKNQYDLTANYPISYHPTNSLMIGAEAGPATTPAGQYFPGKIDDVRIYDYALSLSKIQNQYIAGINSLLSSGQISKEEYNSKLSSLAKTND